MDAWGDGSDILEEIDKLSDDRTPSGCYMLDAISGRSHPFPKEAYLTKKRPSLPSVHPLATGSLSSLPLQHCHFCLDRRII